MTAQSPAAGCGVTTLRPRRSLRAALSEAAEPEDERDQPEEDQDADADHVRRVAQRGGRGLRARVAHDLADVPVLADAAPGEAHQSHQPGERDRQDEERVLRSIGHLPPANLAARFGAADEEHVDDA